MKKEPTSPRSEADFARLDAMTDDEIDFSDAPEVAAEMFANALVREGLKPVGAKAQLALRSGVGGNCKARLT